MNYFEVLLPSQVSQNIRLHEISPILAQKRYQLEIEQMHLDLFLSVSLFATECNTIVEEVDHKKNKDKEDFMYSVLEIRIKVFCKLTLVGRAKVWSI